MWDIIQRKGGLDDIFRPRRPNWFIPAVEWGDGNIREGLRSHLRVNLADDGKVIDENDEG